MRMVMCFQVRRLIVARQVRLPRALKVGLRDGAPAAAAEANRAPAVVATPRNGRGLKLGYLTCDELRTDATRVDVHRVSKNCASVIF